jgi:hypothetical protein
MALKQVGRRLTSLEATLVGMHPAGCATCQNWNAYIITDDQGGATRPDVCPECGWRPAVPRIIHLVGVSVDRL